MSIQSRRDKEKQELRYKIFDAATSIILEEGYEKLSMRKLAERIEYSPTIIYNYFRDKADIVDQIVLENYRECIKAVQDEMARYKQQSVETRFCHAAVCFVTTLTANAPQFRAVLLSDGDMTIPDPEGGETGFDIMEKLLQEGVRDGVFGNVTPYTSQIIVSTLFGLVFHLVGHRTEDRMRVEEMAQECANLLLKGILITQEKTN